VFFSDAVFAIALTLLALDLKLPEGIPADQVDDALVAALPQLLAYALSFVIIAKTWMSHHSDFALIRRFNANLAWLNLALLFFIAMLPGPTSILSDYGDDPTPWPSVLYAANIAAVYLMLAAIWGYAKHAGLMDREMAAHVHAAVRDAGQAHVHQLGHAHPQVLPPGRVVARPLQGVPLQAGEARAGDHERALVRP